MLVKMEGPFLRENLAEWIKLLEDEYGYPIAVIRLSRIDFLQACSALRKPSADTLVHSGIRIFIDGSIAPGFFDIKLKLPWWLSLLEKVCLVRVKGKHE